MVKDIVLTEEEQAERVKAWWKENGSSVITGAIVGLGLIAGYNYWQDWQRQDTEAASAAYEDLLDAMVTPDNERASSLITQLLDEHSGSAYADKALLARAKLETDRGELDAALTSLELLYRDAEESGVRHAATLRMARIQLERDDLAAAASLLAVQDRAGFESHYEELLGDLAVREDRIDAARQHYLSSLASLAGQTAYANIIQLKMAALGPEQASADTDAGVDQAEESE